MNFNWTDNAVMRGLGRLCDFMILNLLWIVFSIPLFTIGASTTALYAVTLKIVKNEEGYIFKGFLVAFKDNFKQATLLWLPLSALGIILIINFNLIGQFESPGIRIAFQIIFTIMSVLLVFVLMYVFPLIARYENTFKQSIQNALLLSIARLPYTILLLLVGAVAVVLTLVHPPLAIFIWMIGGVAILAWINSAILRKAFSMMDPKEEEENEEGEEE